MPDVKRAARIALFALLLAALPLRGYAGVLMSLCEAQHGGAAASGEHAHELGDDHHHDSGDGDSASHAASVCSLCASCCAGAGIAPEAARGTVFQAPVSDRIPFLDRRVSGFVPEHLDRPPLAL